MAIVGPLLFQGQEAEWGYLNKPTKDEQVDAIMVRTHMRDRPDLRPDRDGLICAGPGCDHVLHAGDRALLVTKPATAKRRAQKLWFCSIGCQRRNHLETMVHVKRNRKEQGLNPRRTH